MQVYITKSLTLNCEFIKLKKLITNKIVFLFLQSVRSLVDKQCKTYLKLKRKLITNYS